MKHGLTSTRDSISAGLRGIGVMRRDLVLPTRRLRAAQGARGAGGARGFTLIEITVVVVIITILSALTLVGVGGAIRSARRAAEIELLRNLSRGVESFQQQFGFPPPLVHDDKNGSGPIKTVDGVKRIQIAGASTWTDETGPSTYLRYQSDAAIDTSNYPKSYRYSELSIPYYILGTLDKTIDGVDGPGFTKPLANGQFSKVGGKIAPLFDVANVSERLAGTSADPSQTRLLDRWKNPIRYYRWEPLLHAASGTPTLRPKSPVPASVTNNPAQAGEVWDYNAPIFVGDPRENSSLRGAKWALVSEGPDGEIDYNGTDPQQNADNITLLDGGTVVEGNK